MYDKLIILMADYTITSSHDLFTFQAKGKLSFYVSLESYIKVHN